jgi:DNA invertase Pin-like site-specific DNA recombinase
MEDDMKLIGYCRVSTDKQGKSGLGLESQEEAIRSYAASIGGDLIQIYVEVESGKRGDRPILRDAIDHSQLIGAKLVIHKLDRLSRDLGFITTLQKNSVDFIVVDLPGADRFTVHIFGALAEKERSMISERTKKALEAAKRRGVRLGNKPGEGFTPEIQQAGAAAAAEARAVNADRFAARVRPVIERLQAEDLSLRGIAARLDGMGIRTQRGKEWTAAGIRNLLGRG